jgi:hypothetical protein
MERKTLTTLAFLAACIWISSSWAYPHMTGALSGWYDPVVTPGEVAAAQWAYDNLPHQSQFAGDMFACEMVTAVGFQICSIGGAWELADDPNQRYSDNERAFMTDSSAEAYGLLKKLNVSYVVADERQGFYAYGWKQANLTKFNDGILFEKIYSQNATYIYKVK